MKRFYLIGGTMGVGKTTVCQCLKQRLPACVFLDGDWCWDMHPFVVNDETRQMVMENIAFQLNNFLRCTAFENIVFCWVMHEQSIIDALLSRLTLNDCAVCAVSLVCSPETLRERLQRDIDAGLRQPDVLGRSLARLDNYKRLRSWLLPTDGLTPVQVAQKLAAMGEMC
ncbi:MAG: AAA family ATPase [Butyricicoccaceae bacterium]